MATVQKSPTELNPIQISLLRLFNRPMSDEESIALKKVMVDHYAALLEEEVSKVIKEKEYTQKDFDDMLNDRS